jgi:hypothetical protein
LALAYFYIFYFSKFGLSFISLPFLFFVLLLLSSDFGIPFSSHSHPPSLSQQGRGLGLGDWGRSVAGFFFFDNKGGRLPVSFSTAALLPFRSRHRKHKQVTTLNG